MLTSLKKLDIFNCGLTDRGLQEVFKLTGLTHLSLASQKASSCSLNQLSLLQNLSVLRISTTPEFQQSCLPGLNSLSGLVELNISSSGISTSCLLAYILNRFNSILLLSPGPHQPHFNNSCLDEGG